jgi:hypothetical protein
MRETLVLVIGVPEPLFRLRGVHLCAGLTSGLLRVSHFAIEQIAAMTLVDHHEVVLIDRRRFGIVFREQDAFDESLNGANVHVGFRFGGNVGQAFQAEDVGESLDAHDLGRSKLRLGLLPERVAVDHKANASEALAASKR